MRSSAAILIFTGITFLQGTAAWGYGEEQNGFPSWQERVLLEWTNRARVDPSVEMSACNKTMTRCPDAANDCYQPIAPAYHDDALARAARFHAAELAKQGYFGHDSACTVVSNISTLYPATCDGAASCACVGGVKACSPTCTAWNARIKLFSPSTTGEIISGYGDPNSAFYQWLFESFDQAVCMYVQGPPTNGHRWHLLKTGPSVGFGVGSTSVGDFGGSKKSFKIPSGSHYPRQSASVEAWANFYDTAAPQSALIDVDGTCTVMTLQRGSGGNAAYSTTLTNVASGCHRYYFVFKDSTGAQLTYPTTGSLGIGPAGSCADFDAARPAVGAGCGCVPSCGAKVCGDNGCGGSCGDCSVDQTCQAGQCLSAGGPDGGSATSPDGGSPPASSDGGSPPDPAQDGGGIGSDAAGSSPSDGGEGNKPSGSCAIGGRVGGPPWSALLLLALLALRIRRPGRAAAELR